MKTARLNKTQVLKWTPENEKDPWLRCQSVPGLCLRVRKRKHGWRREFFLSYTWFGRTRYRSLGLVEEWGLEQATEEIRDLKRRIQKAANRGEPDPLRNAAPKRDRLATMEELAEAYKTHSTKAPESQKEERRKWRRLLPMKLSDGSTFGSRPVVQLTSADIWEIRKSMEGSPVSFNRLLALLSNALNLSQRFGLVEPNHAQGWINPCRDVKKYPERSRERVYSVEEYRAIRLALDALITSCLTPEEDKDKVGRHARFKAQSLISFRILARTGLRPVELRTLTKRDVHWSEGFADTRKAKGDRGNSQGRILAFGPKAFEDLQLMRDLSEHSPFFMPSWKDSEKPVGKSGTRTPWKTVKESADTRYGTELTTDKEAHIYVLRHTFVNRHAQAGVDLGDIHDFVGHRSAQSGMITHTYRHTDVPRLLEIAQAMETHMDGLGVDPGDADV